MRQRANLNPVAAALAAATLTAFFWFLLQPISDIDFWWHIASGRWIVTHGEIPNTDPFGVYSDVNRIRNDTVLKGQWLGQVVLYAVTEKFGLDGVISFRAVVLSLCVALVYLRSRMLGAGLFRSHLALIVVGFGVFGFTGERPQLLSFAWASILFLLLDWRDKTGARWPLALLPLLAAAWANSHGGVVLGTALLVLYLGIEFAQDRFTGKPSAGQRTGAALLGIAVALFALASLLAPNGTNTYAYVFSQQGSQLIQKTSEYTSSFLIYKLGYWLPQAWIAVYFVLAAAALPGLARHDWRKVAVVVFLGLISAVSYRYHAFFLLLAAPYVARGLPAPSLLQQRLPRWSSPAAATLTSVGAIALLAAFYQAPTRSKEPVAPLAFPESAARYLQETGLGGRAFTTLNWGGYLLWRLDPQIRVFIDGRMLDDARLVPYTHILWTTPQGVLWFNQAEFDLVVLPYRGAFSSEIYPLHRYLLASGNWEERYRWEGGAVYARSR